MEEELKKLLKTTGKYHKILKENHLTTIKKFLQYFPRTYEDRTSLKNLNEIKIDGKTIIMTKAKIVNKKFIPKWNKKIYEIKFTDPIWQIWYINIFNSWYLAQQIKIDQRYIIIWKPRYNYGKIIFTQPEISSSTAPDSDNKNEKEQFNTGRIYPIYSELQWIKSKRFAKKIRSLIPFIDNEFQEYLPKDFLTEFKLLNIQKTIKNMHYPTNYKQQQQAIKRIFFDRLLRIQLISLTNKENYQSKKIKNKETNIDRNIIKFFLSKLPFELTNAQKKVTKTIIENIHEEKPMMRLLQWDVGSGKTIVATIASYYTYKKFNAQSVFLAPLEVLANQHYLSLSKLLLPLGLRVELLKWSLTKWQKDKIKNDLVQWKIHVLVGTHAILQDDVVFQNLQFATIDEQHKFWVKQRTFFKKFGNPHILQMSATPIPRSMALAFFGEFDVSIIDEMPIWRKEIYTKILSEKERIKIKPRVIDKTRQWQKVFIVTPLIEESEKIEDVKAALTEFEEIKKIYSEIKDQIWLLHGKLKPKDKNKIMNDFKKWKTKILVSTTVIEVWIDIPEATIMIIKNSERFGLSQLHQLRGRIWRSNLQSYCFLETKKRSGDTYKRLKAMEDTNNWFKLAELDLEYRGAGEILWVKQSGETDIPLEILKDISFLETVQNWAKQLLKNYPNLKWLPELNNFLNEKIGDVLA